MGSAWWFNNNEYGMEDMSFEQVDAKLRSIMEKNISLALCVILDEIINNAYKQSNREYYTALEQFEKKYIVPILN